MNQHVMEEMKTLRWTQDVYGVESNRRDMESRLRAIVDTLKKEHGDDKIVVVADARCEFGIDDITRQPYICVRLPLELHESIKVEAPVAS